MSATISMADLFRQRLADRVVVYRQIVNRLAGGARLTDKDDRDAGRALRRMGLPDYAFRRDIRAWAESAHADDQRLAELAWLHPHLFTDAEEWAEARIRSVEAMRSRGSRACHR